MDAARYGQQYAQFLHRLRWIAKIKPLSLAYQLAILTAHYQSPHIGNALQVRQNITHCLGEQFAQSGWQQFIQHTGVANCNIFRMRYITQQWLKKHITIVGKWDFTQGLQTDKPTIFMTYHNHHPFLFTVSISMLGRLIRTLAMNPKDSPVYPYFADIYDQYFIDCEAHYHGGQFVLVDANTPLTATRSIAQTLKNKQIVITLNDVFNPYAEKRSMDLAFYHSQLTCPTGSVAMALRYDADFVAGWVRWVGGDKFTLELYPIDSSQGVEGIMQQYIYYLQVMLQQDAGLWEGWKFFDFSTKEI
jgi:lauroyl/myristoyl acyltransferase